MYEKISFIVLEKSQVLLVQYVYVKDKCDTIESRHAIDTESS